MNKNETREREKEESDCWENKSNFPQGIDWKWHRRHKRKFMLKQRWVLGPRQCWLFPVSI